MKKYFAFALLPFLIMTACNNEEIDTNYPAPEELDGIGFNVEGFCYEDGSRTNIDNDAQFTWAEGDRIGVFPTTGRQTEFLISSGVGTNYAKFDGQDWGLRPTSYYGAYYPLIENWELDKTNITIDYSGQQQTGNDNTSHLGDKDFMAAAFIRTNEAGYCNFQLRHLGALVRVQLTLPAVEDNLTKVTMQAKTGSFIKTAKYDLTAEHATLTATSTTKSLELTLNNVSITPQNHELIVYMMVAPGNYTGDNFTFSVTGNTKIYEGGARGRKLEATKAYRYQATCAYHEYVDLQLPSGTKWATCNLNADLPEQYGDIFAWGETTTQESIANFYGWSSYKWCYGSYNSLTKYCNNDKYGDVDNKLVLDASDDAATVNWGANWKIPTQTQLEELRNSSNCTWVWTAINGVNGYKVTSKRNNRSIFLPAAGCRYIGKYNDQEMSGYYWSSTLNTSNASCAHYLNLYEEDYVMDYYFRCMGQSIRPVRAQ